MGRDVRVASIGVIGINGEIARNMDTESTAIRAVIFDMDGVLIDSFGPHFESWREMFAEYGQQITLADFANTFGKTSRETIPIIRPELDPIRDEPKILEMDRRKEFLYREIVNRKYPVMPGIPELLERLRSAGILIGIGSSAPQENVAQGLPHLDPNGTFFDAVANGSEVEHGKPSPEVFLLALKKLRAISPTLRAEHCVVVEDSPLGIRAAHAAGMTAIGFCSAGHSHEEYIDADRKIDHPDEITIAMVRELTAGNGEISDVS